MDAMQVAGSQDCLTAGCTTESGTAVSGLDGHLFIGDGANRWERQYRGDLNVPESWLAGWAGIFERRRIEAAARGVDIWNVLLPEKQVVYPEKRWPEGAVSGERRPLRLLQPRLDPAHRVLYGADSLLPAKAGGPVWFRRNSHWNPTGCLVVTAQLARALDVQADVQALQFAYRERLVRHDLTTHFFASSPEELAGLLDAPVDAYFNNRLLETTGRNRGASYGLRNPDAADPRRLIVFGDSYAYDVGLTFALAAIFAETVFVWSKTLRWDLVEQHGAQVVVWESAERFLATLPEA